MKVSFGIINYNRLFYLKSCAESLMKSVEDYPDVEFLCIDDSSTEPGTKEYLKSLEDKGWTIIDQKSAREKKPDVDYDDVTHIGPFAEALNIFKDNATGDLIAPLQGDMQFVKKGWLKSYVELFKERSDVFSIMFDAQRKVRLESKYYEKYKVKNEMFATEAGRVIGGAGDVMLKKEYVDAIGGWNAEDNFRLSVAKMFQGEKKIFMPWQPPAIVITTDKTGTNARVRNGKRYGDYWEADNSLYYSWVEYDKLEKNEFRPYSIEELAIPNGDWELPLDTDGNWKKLGSAIDLNNYKKIQV